MSDINVSFSLLLPAALLILWSLVVLLWMAVKRFSAFKVANINLGTVPPGGRGQDLEGVLPREINWPSHNYTHLMEQPTLFYATVLILAVAGQANDMNATLAWVYVLLRIAHSVWQITINRIPVRFLLFLLSTLVLIALAVRTLLALLP